MTARDILRIVLGAAVLGSGVADKLWENYQKVVAKRLSDTFNSTSTLQANFNFIVAEKKHSIAYGCSNYTASSTIADKVREGTWKSIIKPIAVDFEKDFMCFMLLQDKTTNDENLSEVFEWVGPALPSLKVHDSVYGFVESSDEEFKWRVGEAKDLTMYFQSEIIGGDLLEYFAVVVKKLAEYDASPFDSFFWTSTHARPYLEGHHESDADHQRGVEWQLMADTFKHYIAPNKNADICMFQELHNFDVVDGKVVVPAELILDMDDKLKSRACLAYLTVMFATNQFVNHVALTSRPELLNFRSRSIQQSAKVGTQSQSALYTYAGLMGDGQVVSVADTGLDIFSCYFYDPAGHVQYSDIRSPIYGPQYRKVVMYAYSSASDTSDEAGGHGTHVSGIVTGCIAGASITTDGMYDGVAPNAKVAFMDLGVPGSGLAIPPSKYLYGDGYNAGSRVHTNSWGNYFTGSGYYCTHDVDDVLYNNKDFMIFFAAGNAGGNGDGKSTITMDSSGKNMISVGSSETTLDTPDIDYVAWYSSKGPVYDNRIKPDLVAPGDQLMSAKAFGKLGRQSCATIEMTGTSMASPSAAGAALLVRQYFMDTNFKFWTKYCYAKYRSCKSFAPSGSLTKAILLHGVSPMELFNGGGSYDVPLGPPPDYMQGFGRITLKNVLPQPGYNSFDLFVDDLVSIGQYSQKTYLVTIGQSTMKQDLTNYPNGLSSADTLNTVEHLKIKSAMAGVWKVLILSQSLPVYGTQQYSLVITSGGKVAYA